MSERRRKSDISLMQRAMESNCEVDEFVRLLRRLQRRWTPTVVWWHLEKYVEAGCAFGAFDPTAIMEKYIDYPSIVVSALRMGANPVYDDIPHNPNVALLLLRAGGRIIGATSGTRGCALWQNARFCNRERILQWRHAISADLQLHCDVDTIMRRYAIYFTGVERQVYIVLNDVRVAILGQTVDLPAEILRKVRSFLLDG